MTRDEFLSAFFGEGNRIRWKQVEETPALLSLVGDVTDDLARPAVLPRRISDDDVEWFVFCRDDAAFRRAQAEAQAFVGVSYGRWDGIRARLDPADPVERAIDTFAEGRALRFKTSSDEEFRECWRALDLMRWAWRERPTQAAERIRTGAGLVREFEMAVAANDTATAGERLAELRRRGLLGAENLRFLEIRHLAAQGRWRELATAPDLKDLSRIRKPWLVTEDLFTALYRHRLSRFESDALVAPAIAEAQATIEALPELFTTRGPLRSPDVVKLFALRFALPGVEQVDRIRELQELPSLASEDRAWISAIAESVAAPAPPTRDARDLFAEGDVDGAFALATHDEPSVARAQLLMECAFELRTLEAAETALAALNDLEPEQRNGLLARRLVSVAVAEIQRLTDPETPGAPAPTTWTEWLERLLADSDWDSAEAVAACGELEYAADDLLDRGSVDRLANLLLEAADSTRRDTFRDSLPRIVGWLERQDVDASTARPAHAAILTVVALDDSWHDTSLEVAYNAVEALLRAGLDADAYTDMLDQLELLWDRMASRVHAAWLADLFELLELHPGPRDRQVGFVAGATGRILATAERLDEGIAVTLAASCEALGGEELAAAVRERISVAEAPSEAPPDVLRGRLVGIYTLTPQVAVRARDAIERRFPGVRVEVDSSLASSKSLDHLAAAADYLIVSLRSAKHAATDAIERHRPREKPTLIPRGRGSSRMLEALIAAVAEAN
jgi:hypothetical protein